MTLKGKRLTAPGTVASVLTGTGITMAMGVIMSMVLATMMNNEKITEAGMGYGVMLTLMLAAYCGGYTSCKMRKEKRLLTAMLTGMMDMTVLAVINVLFFGAGFYALWETILLIASGCVLSAMWTSRQKGAGKRKKFKFSNG